MKTEHIKYSETSARFSVSRKKFFLLTPPMKMVQCSEKSAQNFRGWGITEKKKYN